VVKSKSVHRCSNIKEKRWISEHGRDLVLIIPKAATEKSNLLPLFLCSETSAGKKSVESQGGKRAKGEKTRGEGNGQKSFFISQPAASLIGTPFLIKALPHLWEKGE